MFTAPRSILWRELKVPNLMLASSALPNTTLVLDRLRSLTGITRDGTGVALPSCSTLLFQTASDMLIFKTLSDPTTAVYAFSVPTATPFYVVAFKPLTADTIQITADTNNRFGTTITADLTTLVGVTADTLVGV